MSSKDEKKRKIVQYGKYYKCIECGHVFKIKHKPLGKVYCPRCGSDKVTGIDKRTYLARKGVIKVVGDMIE